MTFDATETRPPLLDSLREATHAKHRELERDLALLSPYLSPGRTRTLLERFFGFYAVWEPAVGAVLQDDSFFGNRRKLSLLRADLRLLGLDAQDMEELPRCVDAAELARDMDRAMGSLYVLEGATLGGRVISRHLRRLSWRTARRLAFFNPYGAETGAMWMAFCVRAAALSRPTRDPQIVGAAVETFGTIHRWLQPAFARSEKDLLTT